MMPRWHDRLQIADRKAKGIVVDLTMALREHRNLAVVEQLLRELQTPEFEAKVSSHVMAGMLEWEDRLTS